MLERLKRLVGLEAHNGAGGPSEASKVEEAAEREFAELCRRRGVVPQVELTIDSQGGIRTVIYLRSQQPAPAGRGGR